MPDDVQDTTQTATPPAEPPFDRAAFEQMIQGAVSQGLTGALQNASQQMQQQAQVNTAQQPQDDNPFKQWIDPPVRAASLAAQAAEDKVDFYSSEEWQSELDEWLVGDTPDARRKERAEIREQVEKTFGQLIQAGKGMVRRDIYKYVLGQKITRDKTAYQEAIGKRQAARQQADLQRAQRRVDINGTVPDFDPRSLHTMDSAKMVEQYGAIQF